MKNLFLLLTVLSSVRAVMAQPPAIISFTPISGPVGTTVTINGSNFSPIAANNSVYFGAAKAAVTAATSTSLTVVVPVGATSQPIIVTTGGLSGYSQLPFTVTCESTGYTSSFFAPPVQYPAGGTFLSHVAIGDFNGDNKPDLVTTSWNTAVVGILLNNGNGTFAPTVTYPSGGAFPNSVAIGDFNGDSKADLAVANSNSNTIGVLLNNGNGAFAPAVTFPSGGNSPASITTADLNGDGKPDLAVTNQNSFTVGILLNTGNGTFAAPVTYSSGGESPFGYPQFITTADLNGDGKPDLAVANYDPGTIGILLNTGNGTFAAPVTYPTGGSGASTIAISDFNGDNKADLAVGNLRSLNSIAILLNSGADAFAAPVIYTSGGAPRSVAAADFNGDGKPDLAVANDGTQTVGVLLNTGNSTFAAAATFPSGGNNPRSIAAGDLNGDGKPDLAVVNFFSTANTVSVLLNLTSCSTNCTPPTFQSDSQNPACTASTGSITLTPTSGTAPYQYSINGGQTYVDGPNSGFTFQSLGAATYQLRVKDASGCESGVAQKALMPNCPPTITSFAPATGQVGTTITLTGTNFDPVAANNIVHFGAVRATVTAASSTSLTVNVPAGATYEPISVTTNNLTAYTSKPFMVTFSNSCPGFVSNSFSGPTTYPAGTDPRNLATADFDGDEKADIAETNIASGTVSLFRNTSINGTIAFAAKTDVATGAGPERVAAGDFDGDGKPDMAVANGGSGTVSVFRNISTAGNIRFASKTDYATGAASRGVAIGDFDGDGKPDLVVANTNSNTISVLKNTSTPGAISFAAKTDYVTGSGPHALAIGDLDGDNRPDVAVANLSSNTVSVFKNTSTGGTISFTSSTDYPLTGSNSFGIAIGDLDGDGKPELAASSFNSNTLSIFRNTSTGGTIAFASRTDFPVANLPLNIAIADLDGDAKPDLAVSDFNSYNFSVLRNISSIGTVTFAEKIDYGAGVPSTNLVIVDLDGDGRSDIATSAYSIGSLTVFRNQIACAGACTPPAFTRQVVVDAGCGKSDGKLLLSPTSGTAPYQYSLNGGQTYVSGPDAGYTFESLSPGTYQLRIKDAGGCESAIVQQVLGSGCPLPCTAPTFLNDGTIVKAPTCGQSNGSLYLIPTSGTAPFQYSKDGGQTYVSGPANLFAFTGLSQGVYQLRIKDARGCESVVVSKVVAAANCPITGLPPASTNCTTVPTFLNNGLMVKAATCGRSDGGIYLIPTAGTAPFLHSLNGGQSYFLGPDAGMGFQELPAGTYQLRIRDANGCESAVVQRVVPSGCLTAPTITRKTDAVVSDNSNTEVLVYPNPSTGRFRLVLLGLASEKVQVQVVNSKGKVIEQRRVNVSESGAVDFNLSGKAKGLYLIKVVSEKGTQVAKVVVQ